MIFVALKLLVFLPCLVIVHGFVPGSVLPSGAATNMKTPDYYGVLLGQLEAVRRPPPKTANKKKRTQKQKKSTTPKESNGKKDRPSRTTSVNSSTTDTNRAQGPQQNAKKIKSPPPWQTLNAKQAKQNVQKEIARRSSDTGYSPTTENTKAILSRTFLSDTEARLLQWKPFGWKSIETVEFMGGCLTELPERLGVPEVAFLGRSNVGKSSLLNRLANAEVARVGKTPGATASVNQYRMEDRKQKTLLGLVDLPGFGYAKLSKELKDDIGKLAETYLSNRKELAVGVLLVDIRRIPKDDDRAILAALYDLNIPVTVVATKLDKFSSEMERDTQLGIIRDSLGLPEGQPLAVSSVTGDGCRLLWRIIMEACEDHIQLLNRKYVEEAPDEDHQESALVEAFDDHEDVAYEQGYDWIHGSVLFEEEELHLESQPDGKAPSPLSNDESIEMSKMKLQDWHKKSLDMERDGLL